MAEKSEKTDKDGTVIEPSHQAKEMYIKTKSMRENFDVLISLNVDDLTDEERASLRRLLEKTSVNVRLTRTKAYQHLIMFIILAQTASMFMYGIFFGRSIWT